jgi:hypothetical protein
LPDSKYLLLAYKSDGKVTVYTLFTFDPITKSFAKFTTNPALPDSSIVSFWPPLLNDQKNTAYLLANLANTNPAQITVYKVDLSSAAVTKADNTYTLPDKYYLSGIGLSLLPDSSILLTGGNSETGYRTNFSPVDSTLIIKME